MTNEELAVKSQEGDKEALAQLWENVKRFISATMGRRCRGSISRCQTCGVTQEDFFQEGYLAFIDAIKEFDSSSGYKFVTYLTFPLQDHVNDLLGLRIPRLKREPLNNQITSLDEPLTSDLDDHRTIEDSIEDENAGADFENLLDLEYRKALQTAIKKSLSTIDPQQAEIIERRYFQEQSTEKICADLGFAPEDTYRIEANAIRALKRPKSFRHLGPFVNDEIYSRAIRGTGVSAYKTSWTSATEKTVESFEDDHNADN